jgi:hypothetical protein
VVLALDHATGPFTVNIYAPACEPYETPRINATMALGVSIDDEKLALTPEGKLDTDALRFCAGRVIADVVMESKMRSADIDETPDHTR